MYFVTNNILNKSVYNIPDEMGENVQDILSRPALAKRYFRLFLFNSHF